VLAAVKSRKPMDSGRWNDVDERKREVKGKEKA
jgi:hypothetical protein